MNGALNNKWRSEGQRVELQGQESQKQHARMGGTNSVRPNIACIPSKTEMLGSFRRYILIVTLWMGRHTLDYTTIHWSTLEYTRVRRNTLEYTGVHWIKGKTTAATSKVKGRSKV